MNLGHKFYKLSAGDQIYNQIIESSYTNLDPDTQYANFYVMVYVAQTAPFGDFSPTITIAAYDTATG